MGGVIVDGVTVYGMTVCGDSMVSGCGVSWCGRCMNDCWLFLVEICAVNNNFSLDFFDR